MFAAVPNPAHSSMAGDMGRERLHNSRVGAIAEIFGIPISLMLLIPGMFFELMLPCWLLIKGFQPEAYGSRAEVAMTRTVGPVQATR
jgi:hypothetical protein